MSTEFREPKSRTDQSIGGTLLRALRFIHTADTATAWVRCECGALITFDTDGNGRLVALGARTREKHECTG